MCPIAAQWGKRGLNQFKVADRDTQCGSVFLGYCNNAWKITQQMKIVKALAFDVLQPKWLHATVHDYLDANLTLSWRHFMLFKVRISSFYHQSLQNAFCSRCCRDQHNCETGAQADGGIKHICFFRFVSVCYTEKTRTRPQWAIDWLVQVQLLSWESAADVVASVFLLHIWQLYGEVCQVHAFLEPLDRAAGVNFGVAAIGLALVHLEYWYPVAACDGNGDL